MSIPPFGKFGSTKDDPREVKDIPSDYLRHLLEEEDERGWVSERYGIELVEEIESVMLEREGTDTHWHEYEEEGDGYF